MRAKQRNDSHTPNALIDYSTYAMSAKEIAVSALIAAAVLYAIGIVFYMNQFAALALALLGAAYPKVRKAELRDKRKAELCMQFKQALYALSASLAAGKSVENGFRDCVDDLKLLYPDPNTYIVREFEIMNRRVENGDPIELALVDFAGRADLEDVHSFVDVFITCKRTGGDLVEVIRRTSNMISEKLEIQQDISVMIAQKKLESKILTMAPFTIVFLLAVSSPDYMAPLYSPSGALIMTVALLLLVGCHFIAKRIMNVKV